MRTSFNTLEYINSIYENIDKFNDNDKLTQELQDFLMKDTENGKLYKFRCFNKYSLENLSENTMFCARPSTFNDPFDCKMGIDYKSYLDYETKVFVDINNQVAKVFDKYIEIINEELKLSDCSDFEKSIINEWEKTNYFRPFLIDVLTKKVSVKDMENFLKKNFTIVLELYEPFIKDCKIKKSLYRIIKNGNIIYNDFSINDENSLLYSIKQEQEQSDIDEVTATTKLLSKCFPSLQEKLEQNDSDFKRISNELAIYMDNTFRIGCLSTNHNNNLMWSHYADGHKGFCIEYDFKNFCKDLNALLLPVYYSDKREMFPWEVVFPKRGLDTNTEGAKATLRTLLTKDNIWSYENEWRIITLGEAFFKMPPISCIYLGVSCSDKDKKVILEIAKKINVPVKQMKVDRGNYLLHVEEISD